MLENYLAICKYNSWIFKEYLVIIFYCNEMFLAQKTKKRNTNSSSQVFYPKYLATEREDFVIGFVKSGLMTTPRHKVRLILQAMQGCQTVCQTIVCNSFWRQLVCFPLVPSLGAYNISLNSWRTQRASLIRGVIFCL